MAKKTTYSTQIISPVGRVIFPNLASVSDLSKKYEMTLLLTKSDLERKCPKTGLTLVDIVSEVAKSESWKKGGFAHPIKTTADYIAGKEFKASRTQDDEKKAKLLRYNELFSEYDYYVILRTVNQPENIIDRGKNRIKIIDIYSGCYARVAVLAYSYESKDGPGISLGLQNLIQFVKDGEKIGGASISKDDLDDLPEEDDLGDYM